MNETSYSLLKHYSLNSMSFYDRHLGSKPVHRRRLQAPPLLYPLPRGLGTRTRCIAGMISKEAKRFYDRERYLRRRVARFGDRKCRSCEILLHARNGARYSRIYCGDCGFGGKKWKEVDNKHSRAYYYKNRATILEKLRRKHENTS